LVVGHTDLDRLLVCLLLSSWSVLYIERLYRRAQLEYYSCWAAAKALAPPHIEEGTAVGAGDSSGGEEGCEAEHEATFDEPKGLLYGEGETEREGSAVVESSSGGFEES